jgi:2-polyprenyl-6-methoxyphenol hydroxylase-like FAD-dependent oxidoreductase
VIHDPTTTPARRARTHYDIVIAGGGPAGTTVATLALKYNPGLQGARSSRRRSTRASMWARACCPGVTGILAEMGVLGEDGGRELPDQDRREPDLGESRATGGSSTSTPPRNSSTSRGPRSTRGSARARPSRSSARVYDDILFRHAAEHGAECREEVSVDEVLRSTNEDGTPGDRIEGLRLRAAGEVVTGTHYVDATGHVGLIRRAMGVESEAPKELRNVAFWDYWDNAKWKVEIGVGATRVMVRSLPYGWIWFIPLGPTRASVRADLPQRPLQEDAG